MSREPLGVQLGLGGVLELARRKRLAEHLLLLLGLGSRIATVPLIFTMIIAYLTADFDKAQHIFSKPDGFLRGVGY